MKHILIVVLSLFCLASCKHQNNFAPTFAVITKQPINIGRDSAYVRGAIIGMDQVYMRERGFIWYCLTPPTAGPTIKVKTYVWGNSQPGDFSTYIHYQSTPDSFKIRAYAITNTGDSLSGVPVKFLNYTP